MSAEEKTSVEKEAFLRGHGWVKSRGVRIGTAHIPMWSNPEVSETRMGLEMAYTAQLLRNREWERDEAIKGGTAELLCNRCSEPLAKYDGDHFVGYYGLVNASFTTGFYSDDLPDARQYTINLCEKCCKWLFDHFKISAEEERYLP